MTLVTVLTMYCHSLSKLRITLLEQGSWTYVRSYSLQMVVQASTNPKYPSCNCQSIQRRLKETSSDHDMARNPPMAVLVWWKAQSQGQ